VEAYLGPRDSPHPDPGSHTFRGQTGRNTPMFGPAGHLYVYFTYGMHYCANIVCGPPGTASALLLRGGEIVGGEDLARARRTTSKSSKDLASGPARLATALGLTTADVPDVRCTGIAEDLSIRQPELIFLARTARTRGKIEGAVDRTEHLGTWATRAELSSIAEALAGGSEFTPVAVASLLLYARVAWGDGAVGEMWRRFAAPI